VFVNTFTQHAAFFFIFQNCMSHPTIKLFYFLLCMVCASVLMATHNRAGEITYRHISGLTYEATITTYTKTSSVDADRPSVTIAWGDGTFNDLPRNTEVFFPNDIKLNRYTGTHTYAAPFTYIISFTDPNRIENIINISNSINVLFYIEDTLRILDPIIFGFNNSPILLQPPIDFANIGVPWIHNPNAYDIDGDSLDFQLIPPKQNQANDVPGYLSPSLIGPGPNNQISINRQTGEIIWDSPQVQGVYNIAILITEYRNGVKIGTMIRDMQIIVQQSPNQPPQITDIDQICVVAGQTIDVIVNATDPNAPQSITLTAAGAPLLVPFSPATFTQLTSGNPVQGRFIWNTNCEHLRATDYQVVFKAQDSFDPPLADLETVNIKVVAPPPANLDGVLSVPDRSVSLTWDSLYICSGNPRFRGFTVWRKAGCDDGPIDTCNTNLASLGYQPIGQTTIYRFTDNTLERGNSYTYRVVADFADKSAGGFLFNRFSSLASEAVCVNLPLDIPVIYNVDVRTTDAASGQIYIEWSKPKAAVLDTTVNMPPYQYRLYRATGINGTNYSLVFSSPIYTFYSQANDTSFLDNSLNTVLNAYTYKVALFSNNDSLGTSIPASSIFLSAAPTDGAINLSWALDVPWENESYVVFQLNPVTLLYDSIGVTTNTSFFVDGLINDSTYCFKVKGIGEYKIDGLKKPLINFSQEVCARPRDTIPPCPPVLSLRNFCTDSELPDDEPVNYLSWTFAGDCQETDAVKYYIYYSPNVSGTPEVLDSTTDNSYIHELQNSLSGCYTVTALDAGGNESMPSNRVCATDCPIYELPNAFTPNGDGQNDLFTPIKPYRLVSSINMQVFNRWGNLVFETTDPDINWDGSDFKTGKLLDTGVYFYQCKVFGLSPNGEQLSRELKGYIHLFREK
jgi:gliding motility-associated-like protein